MLKIGSIALSAAVAVGLLGGVALAQDEGPQKRENVTYHQAIHWNFKEGHNAAAWEILYEKLVPASRAAGIEFVIVDWETGPWDSTLFVTLKEGYGSLEYAITPGNAAFMASLAKQEGSQEAAAAVLTEFIGHVDSSDSDIGHVHQPAPEEDGDE